MLMSSSFLLALQGKKNVEVRPAHTNKGEIVKRLLYQYPEAEFCMCAGDDKTDEDMVSFRPFALSLELID